MSTENNGTGMDQERLAAFRERLKQGFGLIPFNQLVGSQVVSITDEEVIVEFNMRPELVGNVYKNILHGGVIATVLDGVGGIASMHAVYQKLQGQSREEKIQRMAQLGTIDMRIDYIRPGHGQHFRATGKVIRLGSKICATQMTLHNDKDSLIATANAVFHY